MIVGSGSFFFRPIVKILIFHAEISFFIVGEPIIFGKFSVKFSKIYQEFYRKFPDTPGVSTIPPHTPYPHTHTYIPTYLPIIPLQIDMSQSRVGIFPSDRYEPITCRYFLKTKCSLCCTKIAFFRVFFHMERELRLRH